MATFTALRSDAEADWHCPSCCRRRCPCPQRQSSPRLIPDPPPPAALLAPPLLPLPRAVSAGRAARPPWPLPALAEPLLPPQPLPPAPALAPPFPKLLEPPPAPTAPPPAPPAPAASAKVGRTMSATVAKYFYPHGDAYVSRRSKDADQREAQGQCSSVGAHQALRKSTAFGARSWTSRSSRTRRFKRPLRRLPNARWVTAPSVLRRP